MREYLDDRSYRASDCCRSLRSKLLVECDQRTVNRLSRLTADATDVHGFLTCTTVPVLDSILSSIKLSSYAVEVSRVRNANPSRWRPPSTEPPLSLPRLPS